MKIIRHGKYYYNTMTITCEECNCVYEIKKDDIKIFLKPKKIRFESIDCNWTEKRNYYTSCPECKYDNTLTDDEYYTINKIVQGKDL